MAIQVVNIMESLVAAKLDEVIKLIGCCSCEQCKADITAYALNHTTPKYVVSEQGKLFSKLTEVDIASEANLLKLIVQAAERIREHPKH